MQAADLGHRGPGEIQDHHQRLLQKYFLPHAGSQVVLIVYDLTDPSSFKEVEDYWIQEAKNNSDSDATICLVGNKCDMPRQIED